MDANVTNTKQAAPAGNAAPTVDPVFAVITGYSDGIDYRLEFRAYDETGNFRNRILHAARTVSEIIGIKVFTANGKSEYYAECTKDGWVLTDKLNPSNKLETVKRSAAKGGKNGAPNAGPDALTAIGHMIRLIYPKATSTDAEGKSRKADSSLTPEQKATAERIRWDVAEGAKVTARIEENKARAAAGLPLLPEYKAKPFQSKADREAKKAAKPAAAAPAPVASSAPAQAIATNADARHAARGKK